MGIFFIYEVGRADICETLDGLLEARELTLGIADRVAVAAKRYRHGGPGFVDQMVALVGRGAAASGPSALISGSRSCWK
ncbi:hypothetical protein [Paracoccus sp. Ld10]|uniref:hypothetical protein n=1 Tax=Paracoccus sp. Ld10 TaxID=649158 RepID=UPI00386574D1